MSIALFVAAVFVVAAAVVVVVVAVALFALRPPGPPGYFIHPVSITRFPLSRFSPGAGLLRNLFCYTINAKTFQELGPKRRESCNGDRVYRRLRNIVDCYFNAEIKQLHKALSGTPVESRRASHPREHAYM